MPDSSGRRREYPGLWAVTLRALTPGRWAVGDEAIAVVVRPAVKGSVGQAQLRPNFAAVLAQARRGSPHRELRP